MPRKKRKGVFIELPTTIADALSKVTEHKGLSVEDFLQIQVLKFIPEIVEPKPEARGPGRPARPTPPRLPDDIERAAIASGFAGVYQNGRYWKAFWDKSEGELGVFETVEDAALARYWYNRGRVSVTLNVLKNAGASPDDLTSMARTLGIPPPPPDPQLTLPTPKFKRGEIVNYDPVVGPGPKKKGVVVAEIIIEAESVRYSVVGFDAPVHEEDLEHARP